MRTVVLPDGKEWDAPAGMSDDQIKMVVMKNYPEHFKSVKSLPVDSNISLSQLNSQNKGQFSAIQRNPLYNENISPEENKQKLNTLGSILTGLMAPEAKLASPLLNVLVRSGIGTALGTGIQQANPENVNTLPKNIEQQATINSILNATPYAMGKIGKGILNRYSPELHYNKILDYLGQGAKTVEQNARNLASKLFGKRSELSKESSNLYGGVFSKYGDEPIYQKSTPVSLILPKDIKSSNYNMPIVSSIKLPEGISSDTKLLEQEFVKNPTIQNAHRLQSAIGGEIRSIASEKPSLSKFERLEQANASRNKLLSRIDERLGELDTDAQKKYNVATNFHRENLVPFSSNKKLYQVSSGQKGTTEGIHNIFKYPAGQINKQTGEEEVGPIQKILNHLDEDTKGNILYSKVGGHETANTPQKLLSSLRNSKGYSTYYTPKLNKMIDDLEKSINHEASFKNAASLLGGFLGEAAGHASGIPFIPTLTGYTLGKSFPSILNAISKSAENVTPVNNLLGSLYRSTGRTYGTFLANPKKKSK